MGRIKFTYIYLILLVFGVTIRETIFIVWEGEQALVTQFGEIIRRPITEAGVHFKIPYIQQVELQDRRILSWEGTSEQIPTGDQRYISIKSMAMWRIDDLAEFVQTVQSIPVARARLDSVINGALRDVISGNDLVEAVRTNNDLFQHPWITDDVARETTAREAIMDERELYTVLSKVSRGRQQLEKKARITAHRETKKFGISLVALNIMQISYQPSVERTVHERMISDRKRVAEKIRAVGYAEEARWRGRQASDYQAIVAPAYRQAEELKGLADQSVVQIYGQALQADPKFYTFMRTMDAYRRGLTQQKGELILSSQSNFFDGLQAKFSE